MTEPTDIVFTRHQGHAITVDTAPEHTRISLHALVDRYAYLHMPDEQTIVFADQVVYRITGYDAGALELELVQDWRPAAPETTEEKTMPTCTATIEGPHIPGGGPVQCTRKAGHPENHVGPQQGDDGKTLWTDHHAGATPHGAVREESTGA
jgi:hypothetical protein